MRLNSTTPAPEFNQVAPELRELARAAFDRLVPSDRPAGRSTGECSPGRKRAGVALGPALGAADGAKQAGGNAGYEVAAGSPSAVMENASAGSDGSGLPLFAPPGRGSLRVPVAVALDGLGPVSFTSLLLRTTQLIKSSPSQKPCYYCERSRFTLVGPGEVPGTTRLTHAPCKSNTCPYCGRVKMYQKRNRIYARLAADKASGLDKLTSYEFVTLTLRAGIVTKEEAFSLIKLAAAYAIQKVRKPRKFNKRYRRGSWCGANIAYINDVDIQPGTQMAHSHGLWSVSFPGVVKLSEGKRRRLCNRMAKELHYYVNNFVCKRLGLPVLQWREGEPYPYQGVASVAYVHFSAARSSQNAVNYMALHNGKIWRDGREYPRRYRRFSTSRGYLPKVEKSAEPSAWAFVQNSLAGVVGKLEAQGVAVGPAALSDLGYDGAELSRLALVEPGSYRMRHALGLVKEGELAGRSCEHPPLETLARIGKAGAVEVLAKMQRLEEYWESGAAEDGGRYEEVKHEERPEMDTAHAWLTNDRALGLVGPAGVSLRFVPGVSFLEWSAGAAPLSLGIAAEPGKLVPGVHRGAEPLMQEECAEVASLRALCPSMTEHEAREWVAAVRRIRAKKAAGGTRRGASALRACPEARRDLV